MKCSLVLSVMFHDAKIATIPNSPVSKISGALIPSTDRKYWTGNDSGNHEVIFSDISYPFCLWAMKM